MSASSASPAPSDLLRAVQDLYDQRRFLDAYALTKHLWREPRNLDDRPVDELILGARLARRLGGARLSRWLQRKLRRREPENPRVRYFAPGDRAHIFDELREMERCPDLGGDDVELRASWLASRAYSWALLRDFRRAEDHVRRAHELRPSDGWVLSCESEILGLADRWPDALLRAEAAWEQEPGAPYAADALGTALLNQGRAAESATRLESAAERGQSYEVAKIAAWHMCAWAESLDGQERRDVLERARALANRLEGLAPLADRETRSGFARTYLDIACLADEHAEMERWAEQVRSPFHREVLKNLRENPEGKRVRLPFRRVVQRVDTCLPTAVSSALAANGLSLSAEEMAAEVTFGGTTEWAAADWLRERGLHVRFFAATSELAMKLIRQGIAFIYSSDGDESGHSVAVVGLDEAAGTLLIHDPNSFRSSEYLASYFDENRSPLGYQCMAAVPMRMAAELDALLPAEAEVVAAAHAHQRATTVEGAASGAAVVKEIATRFPAHPGTRLLQGVQAVEEGYTGEALRQLAPLFQEYPESPMVRVRVLSAYRALGNTAQLREALHSIVESGVLPGMQSQTDWRYPPARYEYEYADLLRQSASTRGEAKWRLRRVLRRQYSSAGGWHIMADLLWQEMDREGALLAYRVASCLSYSDEHYARAYADALRAEHREEEGLAWLEQRVRDFGGAGRAAGTWQTWIEMLEEWGRPERAIAGCREALQVHGGSPELLVFAITFLARMGKWKEAEEQLGKLEADGETRLLHEARHQFYQMRGETGPARAAAESWVREAPRTMAARSALLEVVAAQEGADAAVTRAAAWLRAQPAHEELEEAYCQQLDRAGQNAWRTYSVLLRRLKRNPEDAWAWREVAFTCINRTWEKAPEKARARIRPRIEKIIAECVRTAPEDAATLRVQALWLEEQGRWEEAAEVHLAGIERDPASVFSYRRMWDCCARSGIAAQQALWTRVEPWLMNAPGRLPGARTLMGILADAFGAVQAERTIERWMSQRPEDPDVVEAAADLLIEHGHGRSDAERAVALLGPAVERFPYHSGLRFSLMSAYRGVGRDAEAEQVLQEILRRHPGNPSAHLQAAWLKERAGDLAGAEALLDRATTLAPRDVAVWEGRAGLLIRSGQFERAVRLVQDGLELMPDNVGWRERAIDLLIECGEDERAVRTARQGVEIYPRGSYLWLLMGRTLSRNRGFAAPGEIEGCLRRSLQYNAGLFAAADWLARYLVEQRQYDEADEVVRAVEQRMADPCAARGRRAWILRERGGRAQAVEALSAVLNTTPGYPWGWVLLIDWLEEDKNKAKTLEMLRQVPPQMASNIKFRYRRLAVLEQAELPTAELDSEWDQLLRDFPEEVPLYVTRYDSLDANQRYAEAAQVLEAAHAAAPDSTFVLSRRTEVLMREGRADEAMAAALEVWFAPVEESRWPADKAWEVMKNAKYDAAMYRFARARLANGCKPTPQAWSLMVEYGIAAAKPRTTWFSLDRTPPGEREGQELLAAVANQEWEDGRYRAEIFRVLVTRGHVKTVLKQWRRKGSSENHVGAWVHIGRALAEAKERAAARAWLRNWRERKGVGMWMVANYLLNVPRRRRADLQDVVRTCEDALTGLPHDHCARYLAYLQAEAHALLGDRDELLAAWRKYAAYFDGTKGDEEYFHAKEQHLMAEIPMLVRFLEQDARWLYQRRVWQLRWIRFTGIEIDEAIPTVLWWTGWFGLILVLRNC